MPTRLIWLEEAERHLQSVFDYIVPDSPRAAKDYIEDILGACERLRSFPASGRRYDNRFRVLIVRNHLVFYRHDADRAAVIIVAIIDGRRDVAAVPTSLAIQPPERPTENRRRSVLISSRRAPAAG